MKKVLILFAFLYGSLIQLHAQSVQINDQNFIEINPAISTITQAEKTSLGEKLAAYDLYEIDLPALRSQVLQNPSQADLIYNFPNKKAVKLSIYENEMRSQNFRATAMTDDGPVEVKRADCSTYKGFTSDGGDVRLSITEDFTYGFFTVQNEIFVIQSLYKLLPNSDRMKVAVYKLSDYIGDPDVICRDNEKYNKSVSDNGTEKHTGNCHYVEFATDVDVQQFNADGSVAAANATALAEMNVAEGLYENVFDLDFIIVFQNVWTTAAADPYVTTNANNDGVEIEVRTAWTAGALGAVQRDYVILFSGRAFTGGGGGVAGSVFTIGALCDIPNESYAFVSVLTGTPLTNSHEIGHAMGGQHGDGANCATNAGTLMCPGTFNNINVFSADNFDTIEDHIHDSNCLHNGNSNLNTTLENNLGTWTQDNTDNLNWTFSTGGTPSNNTGPSGAYQGNSYLYTEASSGNSNRTARLLSAPYIVCLDNSFLSFGYHMRGTSMGTLRVQVSVDGGGWQTIWTRTGNQGNVWHTAGIGLNAFMHDNIVIRISGTTGTSWSSDIAIDDIALGGPCPVTVSSSLVGFAASGGTQSVSVSSGGIWEAHVFNLPNWVSISPFPFFNGLNITVDPNTSSNGRTATITLSCGPNTQGITVAQSGVQAQPCNPNSSLPNNVTFESTWLNGWSQDPNDDINFTRQSGQTPSGGTGPLSAAQGSFYMFTEASFGNSNKVANLVSPCYNLSGIPSPKITFSYNMHATTASHMGTLRLQVSTNDGSTWSTIFTKSGPQGQAWIDEDISLSNFTNTPIRLRFNATTGPNFKSDISIDDIQVKSGTCYDQYESNNTLSTAHGTTMGSFIVLSNACLSAGDNDYYRFFYNNTNFYARVRGNNGATGDYQLQVSIIGTQLTVETIPQNGSTTDTYLYVYTGTGFLIGLDNNSGQGLFSKVTTTLPTAPDGVARDGEDENGSITLAPSFELRNYPNPFNQTTNFDFYLENESTISLIISDITGKVVAMPISNVTYEAGNHIFEYSASALPAGVYNYSLRTQDGMKTKQMVIVR